MDKKVCLLGVNLLSWEVNIPILIFLHIPKTAGSTLGYPMHRQYPRESIFLIDGNYPEKSVQKFLSLPIEERNQYSCISGHIPFGLHQHISQDVHYVTILRDPVERLISLYHHILHEETHYLYQAVTSEQMTLLDFVSSRLSTELCNDQTRRISGLGEWNQKTDQTRVDEHVFQKALENIETFFPVIGLTEMFDHSLLLMKDAFSWKNVFYSRRKVAKSRPSQAEIHSEVINVIKKRNRYDILLYHYAQQRLEEQIKEKGFFFKKRVQQFCGINNIYNFIRNNKKKVLFHNVWLLFSKLVAFQRTIANE